MTTTQDSAPRDPSLPPTREEEAEEWKSTVRIVVDERDRAWRLMLQVADKLEEFGNEEPRAVADTLRRAVPSEGPS